jgi:hypothetical protein
MEGFYNCPGSRKINWIVFLTTLEQAESVRDSPVDLFVKLICGDASLLIGVSNPKRIPLN